LNFGGKKKMGENGRGEMEAEQICLGRQKETERMGLKGRSPQVSAPEAGPRRSRESTRPSRIITSDEHEK
jgi:hypothetical protein